MPAPFVGAVSFLGSTRTDAGMLRRVVLRSTRLDLENFERYSRGFSLFFHVSILFGTSGSTRRLHNRAAAPYPTRQKVLGLLTPVRRKCDPFVGAVFVSREWTANAVFWLGVGVVVLSGAFALKFMFIGMDGSPRSLVPFPQLSQHSNPVVGLLVAAAD